MFIVKGRSVMQTIFLSKGLGGFRKSCGTLLPAEIFLMSFDEGHARSLGWLAQSPANLSMEPHDLTCVSFESRQASELGEAGLIPINMSFVLRILCGLRQRLRRHFPQPYHIHV